MNADPIEAISKFGEYGGILGMIIGVLLSIIIINMILAWKRQNRFDDRMLEAVNHSKDAMNNLANAVGKLPCTVLQDQNKNPRD